MNNKKSSEELKKMTREQLTGNYGTAAGMLLFTTLLSTVLAFLVEFLLGDYVAYDFRLSIPVVLYFLINFIISLLLSVFTLGLNYYYLNIAKSRNRSFQDLFYGFKRHPDKIIILTIILSLLYTLCTLPGSLLMAFAYIGRTWILVLLGFVLLIAGIVISIILMLRYGLVSYILIENPEKSVMQIMKESKDFMTGNKGRLFYLMVSFFGWYLLAFLSCGIGSLWVSPYMSVTFTNFYLDIKEAKVNPAFTGYGSYEF